MIDEGLCLHGRLINTRGSPRSRGFQMYKNGNHLTPGLTEVGFLHWRLDLPLLVNGLRVRFQVIPALNTWRGVLPSMSRLRRGRRL